jgi:hypothetical protein
VDVLEINSISLTAGADTFSLLGVPADLANNPVMLDLGESFTFGAAFDPNRLGLLRATIDIATNDPDQPLVRVGAVGTGIDPLPYPHWGNDFVAIETPDVPASPVLRVTSDDEGNFEIFLAPQTMYHMVIFDPVTGLVSHSYGRTAPTGSATDLTASIVFGASMQADGDFEGLPEDIEFAVGTMNPRFTPAEVLVEPAVDLSGRLIAYLPTFFAGLTIVDVTNPTLPTVLSDLPLNGNSQDVSLDSGGCGRSTCSPAP